MLSCGHSSLTLYIQLYLSGYGLTLDDLKALRTWGSLTPGHPEHGLTAGRRDHHRPARPGHRPTRSAWPWPPAASAACSTRTPPPARARSTTTSTSSPPTATSRRASATRPPPLAGHQQLGNLVADLRRQPHLDRGRHGHRQVRGRRRAVRGLRLARPAGGLAHAGRLPGGRRRRCADALMAARDDTDRPVDHRAAHDHRLARAATSRTPARRTAPRWARTRSPRPRRSSASTRTVRSRPRTRWSPTPARSPTAASSCTRGVGGGASPRGRAANPDRAALLDRLAAPAAAGRLGRRAAGVPGRRQGHGHPQGVRRGAQRARPGAARAVGRLGRPGGQQQHDDGGRAVVHPAEHQTEMFPGNPYGRTLHFGIREHAHGRDPERHRAARAAPGPTAAPSWSSATTCGPRSGWPR